MADLSFIGEPERIGLQVIGEFMSALGKTYTYDRVFRGHANSSWKPIPAAFREGANGIDTQGLFEMWKRRTRRFLPSPSGDLEFLVLAQHYGIPTALLDWTANPLIALYFACSNFDDADSEKKEQAEGLVIQLDTFTLPTIKKNDTVSLFKSDRQGPILLDTAVMNARTMAQDSLMTLHTRGGSELGVTPVFCVSHTNKMNVKRALNLFGITEERVFPDLTVAATSFRELLIELDDL